MYEKSVSAEFSWECGLTCAFVPLSTRTDIGSALSFGGFGLPMSKRSAGWPSRAVGVQHLTSPVSGQGDYHRDGIGLVVEDIGPRLILLIAFRTTMILKKKSSHVS
jgi:hypothetical protein